MEGNEVNREMIRDYPRFATRESPVYRKRSQQLKYIAIGRGYSIDPRYDRFKFTEVHFLNFRDGTSVVTVSEKLII